MRPKVSVIIPAYNSSNTISNAIRSVREKKGTTEIIVVDDGSKDLTPYVVGSLQHSVPNLSLITHKTNRGVSAARNTGIEEARGEYIAFLDSDDQWAPNKAFVQMKKIKNGPHPAERVFCVGYYSFHFGDPRKLRIYNIFADHVVRRKGHFRPVLKKYSAEQAERGALTWKLWFGIGSTLLAHRDAIARNGPFNEKLGFGEDTEYVVRHLTSGGRLEVVPRPVMFYLQPKEGKVYRGQELHFQHMIETYRCSVATTFGPDVAKEFVASLDRSHSSRNTIGFKKSSDEIMKIAPGAPCQSGYACALKGAVCHL